MQVGFRLLRACMEVLLALARRRLGFSKEGMKLKAACEGLINLLLAVVA